MKGWRNGSSTSILHLEGFRLIRQSSRGLLFTYIVAPWNYVSIQFRPSSVIVLGGRKVYETLSRDQARKEFEGRVASFRIYVLEL